MSAVLFMSFPPDSWQTFLQALKPLTVLLIDTLIRSSGRRRTCVTPDWRGRRGGIKVIKLVDSY